ncbi:Nudix hydrolase [Micractinium conductrix]|uniref:Nudix hydrolase n=1 Tax=Micractinium conductrix TaxID=554055 RepID=A0A2P6VPN0_9CHLO|nr:Nudix hydrolase [Micractinium conductrix]|eukprot:PSC76064.1 Nudix hydrolase [Micractinium conductrix]
MSEALRRPLVGVGVLIFQADSDRVLVGQRKGAHGGGEWALPGGHLEHGESFEECAAREVLEETGLTLEGVEFAYAVNSVFPNGAHYVTVFCRASEPAGTVPVNAEPDKCEGWEWVEYSRLVETCQPLFLPLAKLLLESPYHP